MIRCVICGCSRLDSKGVGCLLCGGSPSFRDEECHVTGDTKAKLLEHADELEAFGVTLEKREPLQKDAAMKLAIFAVVLQVADSLKAGVLRDLVLFLRDLAIPEEQILRLRLDEPEEISKILNATVCETHEELEGKLSDAIRKENRELDPGAARASAIGPSRLLQERANTKRAVQNAEYAYNTHIASCEVCKTNGRTERRISHPKE